MALRPVTEHASQRAAFATTSIPQSRSEQSHIGRLSQDILKTYAESAGTANACDHDPGPVLLAAALLERELATDDLAFAAVERWFDELPQKIGGIGPFGGLGGYIAALRAAQRMSGQSGALLRSLYHEAPTWISQVNWASSDVVWRDYDYFTGPSGYILSALGQNDQRALIAPALDHLLQMCATVGLSAFRGGPKIDQRSAFNTGRINTGLGHGMAGVLSALTHATRVLGDDDIRGAVRAVADWLMRAVIVDDSGLITWPPVGADQGVRSTAVSTRQAWCYGTPGVAWALWDSATILDDPDLAEIATTAMQSFCIRFDDKIHFDDDSPGEAISLCHGAIGTLVIADAFYCHADLAEAGQLRAELQSYILDRSDQLIDLATHDMSLLTGAGGVMALLLAAQGGDRSWLPIASIR